MASPNYSHIFLDLILVFFSLSSSTIFIQQLKSITSRSKQLQRNKIKNNKIEQHKMIQNCIEDDTDVSQAVKIVTSGILDHADLTQTLTEMMNRTQT